MYDNETVFMRFMCLKGTNPAESEKRATGLKPLDTLGSTSAMTEGV